MKIRRVPFNIYLLLLSALLSAGCHSPQERKQNRELSTLRLHLEVNPDGSDRSAPVPIVRRNPTMLNVERAPFLDEGDVQQAVVVETIEGFALKIQFDAHGKLVMDSISTSNKGRRMAVFSQFGDARWLAAPQITQRIRDGVLVFTPDANREEAERIARGLNNVVAQLKRKSFPQLFEPK